MPLNPYILKAAQAQAQPPAEPAKPYSPELEKVSKAQGFFKKASASIKQADQGGMGSMPASGVPTGPPDNAPNRISPAPAPPPMGVTTSQGAPVPAGPAPMKLQMPQKPQ